MAFHKNQSLEFAMPAPAKTDPPKEYHIFFLYLLLYYRHSITLNILGRKYRLNVKTTMKQYILLDDTPLILQDAPSKFYMD